MFEAQVYRMRREALRRKLEGARGIVLFPGHEETPMNFPANPYPFRQDSSFLYYFGHARPRLAGWMDLDSGEDWLFAPRATLEDVVWTGYQPEPEALAEAVGAEARDISALPGALEKVRQEGRPLHVLPQYRPENLLRLHRWLGLEVETLRRGTSEALIRAVVAQRSIKQPEEVAEIERALEVSARMHTEAMRMGRVGRTERELAGYLEGLALAYGRGLSFPIILTQHGEILHNHPTDAPLEEGRLVLHDSGVNSPAYYASDITRTFPVSGRFTTQQREIYEVVLRAQEAAMAAVRPGVYYRDVHLLAARKIVEGLQALGLMQGDVEEAVAAGAHALFFCTGLGHMLGLDVHDMEALGEEYVGYDETVQRSTQFGLNYLRLARRLEPGFVLTVEPGIYFIPPLMDRWEAEGRHRAFIRYEALKAYRDAGGVRIEDDVLVTETGHRVLGPSIPKAAEAVEALCLQ